MCRCAFVYVRDHVEAQRQPNCLPQECHPPALTQGLSVSKAWGSPIRPVCLASEPQDPRLCLWVLGLLNAVV